MKGTVEKICGKVALLVIYLNKGEKLKNVSLRNFYRNKETFFIRFTIRDRLPETIHGEFEFSITKRTEPCENGSVYSPKNKKIATHSKVSFLLSSKKKDDCFCFKRKVTKYLPSGGTDRDIRMTFKTLEGFWENLLKLGSKLSKKRKVRVR